MHNEEEGRSSFKSKIAKQFGSSGHEEGRSEWKSKIMKRASGGDVPSMTRNKADVAQGCFGPKRYAKGGLAEGGEAENQPILNRGLDNKKSVGSFKGGGCSGTMKKGDKAEKKSFGGNTGSGISGFMNLITKPLRNFAPFKEGGEAEEKKPRKRGGKISRKANGGSLIDPATGQPYHLRSMSEVMSGMPMAGPTKPPSGRLLTDVRRAEINQNFLNTMKKGAEIAGTVLPMFLNEGGKIPEKKAAGGVGKIRHGEAHGKGYHAATRGKGYAD